MKRNTDKKSTAQTVALIVAAVVVFAAAAGACVYKFYVKPHILEPIQQIQDISDNGDGENSFSSTLLLDEIEAVLQEEDVRNYINQTNPEQATELMTVIEDAKIKNRQKKEEAAEASEQPAETAQPEKTPEPTAAPTSKSTSKPSKYDKYKDQVDPKDLKDAMSIAGKVDAGYILGLTSGGLTSEERSELKKYLMSRLSSSEISRGIQLFAKYSYLL